MIQFISTSWKVIMAGVCFSSWPLLLNASGVCCNPLKIKWLSLSFYSWSMLLGAIVTGLLGFICLTTTATNASARHVSAPLMVMLAAQVAVLAIHHMVTNGGISFEKSVGLVLLTLGSILLLKA